MTQTWIVFKIGNHKVHQMSDSGSTGEDMISATKTMVAGEYKVSEDDIKISFADEEVKPQSHKDTVVSSELLRTVRIGMTKKEIKN